jgi:hypothetical protein
MKLLALLCLLALPLLASASDADLPAASKLIARVVERAQLVARETQTNHYFYDKRTITSELDESGAVIKSTEKLYRVELNGGLPFPRLVKIEGRALTPRELEKESQREAVFRQNVTHVDMNDKAKRREGFATKELVEHFDFTVTKREMIEGRPTVVATFKPRHGGAEVSIEDRIYQKLSGTVWVDERDAEIAKVDAHLDEPVPVGWFGAVGSLNQFQGTMERSRLPDGVWVNRKTTFTVMARKLFVAMRSKTTAESSGFKRG